MWHGKNFATAGRRNKDKRTVFVIWVIHYAATTLYSQVPDRAGRTMLFLSNPTSQTMSSSSINSASKPSTVRRGTIITFFLSLSWPSTSQLRSLSTFLNILISCSANHIAFLASKNWCHRDAIVYSKAHFVTKGQVICRDLAQQLDIH